jgi:signal transduction histidine kinase
VTAVISEEIDYSQDRPRVLVVDDDESNLLALTTVIEDVAEVVTAKSGDAALRYLLQGDFAAILLDVYMPTMDGYETASLIRQREQSKRIPIIFMSAINKEEAHLMRGYAMGAVDYVFKPVEPTVLRSKVAVFVDLYEMTREVQRKAEREQLLRDENLRIQQEALVAEKALRRAEERQALILKSLPIVLYLEAPDASPRLPHYVSGDLKGITGFDFEEVQANPATWTERLHADDRERVLRARANIAQQASMAVEYRWLAADGEYRHLLEHAVLLPGPQSDAMEVAGTLFDVTSQRRLEQQLGHAQKMDAVGKLTGGIAHDFNNLLAAVIGGLGLIERRCELDDKGKNLVKMTVHAAEQGAELVKRLLAFSRRQRLDPAPVPVSALHNSLVGMLESTLGGLVEMEWLIPSDIWSVLADANQLELAVMNLIINARDAMPTGGKIVVSAQNRRMDDDGALKAGDYIIITVRDSGTGIAPELMAQIFEPFVTTKEIGKGTGLGLSMVYGFALQSGGTVIVNSKPDEGAEFQLWLPRAASDIVEIGEGPTIDTIGEIVTGARILLVDDHDGVRAVTHEFLTELGYFPISASSAAGAMEILQSEEKPFDVLLTDYAMPRGSGTELIREVRKLYPKLPAIIMTGYANSEMIADRPRNTSVIIKPVASDALRQAIQAAIG